MCQESGRSNGPTFAAEANASYDVEEEIELSALEPLIALPSSPGKVVPVREVEGQDIYQSYIGSSAAAGLVQPGARLDELRQTTFSDQLFEGLA